jgi:outer membrane murein-binding lipoprotein Lpp
MKTRWMILAALAVFLPVAASGQPQPQAPPAKKPKKVWTNEDLEALREKVNFSSFGEGAASGASASQTSDAGPASAVALSPDQETPEQRMQKRIAALRGELAGVEQEIRTIRNASTSGRTTGQKIDMNNVDAGLNTEARVAQLEQRRKQIQQQIDAAEDEARRMGMSAGSIR